MRRSFILLAAVAAVLVLAPPASATHIQCGATITQSDVLDSNVVCTAGAPVGVTIAANNVTLRLGGWTISKTGGGGVGVRAVPTAGEYTNVVVKKGTITGFNTAVEMTASDSAVVNVAATAPGYGADLRGDRNRVEKSAITGGSGVGIYLEGEDVSTYKNTVSGYETAMNSVGDRPTHVLNEVSNCSFLGIDVTGYATRAVVNRNSVTGCSDGIVVESGSGARVRLNTTNGNDDVGLEVGDSAAIIENNTSSLNGGTGILSTQSGTRIGGNTANSNGEYGIDAAAGTVDGGGNTATGNGNTPQCVNVSCTP
jgi:hypothetical protein